MHVVLFACVQNAGRSQMAAALFAQAADPGKAKAISAGTRPAAAVHAEVVDAMSEIGVDLSGARPRLLDADLARQATVLVTMGCGDSCPVVPGTRVVEWDIPDPHHASAGRVREIRDQIAARVRQLVDDLGCGAAR